MRISRRDAFSFALARKLLAHYEATLHMDMRAVLDKIAESLEGDISIEPDWLSEHVGVLPEDRVRIDPEVWAHVAGHIERREAMRAGKTRLVQAVSQALGVDPQDVVSPRFVLIHEYQGRLPIYHFDVYRLRDDDEFLQLGPNEYFENQGVTFVEWGGPCSEPLAGRAAGDSH